MKKMSSLIIAGSLTFVAAISFADNTSASDMSFNWVCTTNASKANNDLDKVIQNRMANNKTSAANAYAFASQNCGDCTKITCEIKN